MKLLVGRDPRIAQTALNALISLLFAVLIWAAVGARITEVKAYEVTLELHVPKDITVEFRDPPALPGRAPKVRVSVRGPNELLAKLGSNELQCVHELTNVDDEATDQGTEREVALGPQSVRTGAKGIEIVGVTPERVKFVLARADKRPRRVKAETAGVPAPGFKVAAVALDLEEVDVAGPRALLSKHLGPFKTEPVDVTGRRESFTSYRSVVAPEGLKPEDRVKVTVVIEPEPQEREFPFPVRLLTNGEALKPGTVFDPPLKDWVVRVLVKGPAEALTSLETRLATFKELPGEPLAFVRLSAAPDAGPNELYVEVVNLPRELTYTKAKLNFKVIK